MNTSWIFILVDRGRDPIPDRENHMGTFQSMEKENVDNHLVGHPLKPNETQGSLLSTAFPDLWASYLLTLPCSVFPSSNSLTDGEQEFTSDAIQNGCVCYWSVRSKNQASSPWDSILKSGCRLNITMTHLLVIKPSYKEAWVRQTAACAYWPPGSHGTTSISYTFLSPCWHPGPSLP